MGPASLAYFHAYQDEQTRGWSVYLIANRWLGVRIDFIIGVFIAILALSAIPLASSECGNNCVAHVYAVSSEVQEITQCETRILGTVFYLYLCNGAVMKYVCFLFNEDSSTM